MAKTIETATFASGPARYAKATFAGGCFWCTEAIFQKIRGVEKVVSGYTGHAEAVQITYNPEVISYDDLLYIFWRTHDPTTTNRQGSDVGPQYRSMILYHDGQQKKKALKSKEELENEKVYKDSIITEIVPLDSFYKAEEYHQDYYSNNHNKPYCKLIIDPKIKKLEKDFQKYLK